MSQFFLSKKINVNIPIFEYARCLSMPCCTYKAFNENFYASTCLVDGGYHHELLSYANRGVWGLVKAK